MQFARHASQSAIFGLTVTLTFDPLTQSIHLCPSAPKLWIWWTSHKHSSSKENTLHSVLLGNVITHQKCEKMATNVQLRNVDIAFIHFLLNFSSFPILTTEWKNHLKWP